MTRRTLHVPTEPTLAHRHTVSAHSFARLTGDSNKAFAVIDGSRFDLESWLRGCREF